jgi:hypothetical protein
MQVRKQRAVRESPNASSEFWKERCVHENNHKYVSTVKGLISGKIEHIPVTGPFAQNISQFEVADPVKIASNLRNQ